MSALAVEQVKEAIDAAFGSFDPQSVTEVRRALGTLNQIYEALGTGVGNMADRIAQGPYDSGVPEHLRDLSFNTHQSAEVAYGVGNLLEKAHEAELNRIDNPRPGEEQFDVSRQET